MIPKSSSFVLPFAFLSHMHNGYKFAVNRLRTYKETGSHGDFCLDFSMLSATEIRQVNKVVL